MVEIKKKAFFQYAYEKSQPQKLQCFCREEAAYPRVPSTEISSGSWSWRHVFGEKTLFCTIWCHGTKKHNTVLNGHCLRGAIGCFNGAIWCKPSLLDSESPFTWREPFLIFRLWLRQIFGLSTERLRERLLQEWNLTWSSQPDLIRRNETTVQSFYHWQLNVRENSKNSCKMSCDIA